MFLKLYKNSSVKNILVITLTNIGDAVFTAPTIDVLLRDFPQAKLSIVVGANAASLFEGNPRINKIHIFDKRWSSWEQFKWVKKLRAYNYDLVVDLRNSMIGYPLLPRWITPPVLVKHLKLHLKDQHLKRLNSLYDFDPKPAPALAIKPTKEDDEFVNHLFNLNEKPYIVIAPCALDSSKAWSKDQFARLCDAIAQEYQFNIVMIGSKGDVEYINNIQSKAKAGIINLAGQTNMIQTASLLNRASIAIAHDSGPMHLAGYLNRPILALFGPTVYAVSGPVSNIFRVICHKENCPRCLNPKSNVSHECMKHIPLEEVLIAFREIYEEIQ